MAEHTEVALHDTPEDISHDEHLPEPAIRTTTGPTIHVLVEEERIGRLTDHATSTAFSILNSAKQEVANFVNVAVQKAYREGLRDGFMQGAIAEAKSHV